MKVSRLNPDTGSFDDLAFEDDYVSIMIGDNKFILTDCGDHLSLLVEHSLNISPVAGNVINLTGKKP